MKDATAEINVKFVDENNEPLAGSQLLIYNDYCNLIKKENVDGTNLRNLECLTIMVRLHYISM